MFKKALKTVILVGPTILPMGLLFTPHLFPIGLVALAVSAFFLLSVWKKNLILKIPAFFRGILATICAFAYFVFFCMSLLSYAIGNSECGGCVNTHELVAKNGEKFDLSKGVPLKKSNTTGFQDCSCGKVFSFEKNSEYALSQIEKMGDYWTHLSDCSSYTLYNYAEATSFDLTGDCYLHKEDIRYDEDITLIYNKRTNKLLYLFYSS